MNGLGVGEGGVTGHADEGLHGFGVDGEADESLHAECGGDGGEILDDASGFDGRRAIAALGESPGGAAEDGRDEQDGGRGFEIFQIGAAALDLGESFPAIAEATEGKVADAEVIEAGFEAVDGEDGGVDFGGEEEIFAGVDARGSGVALSDGTGPEIEPGGERLEILGGLAMGLGDGVEAVAKQGNRGRGAGQEAGGEFGSAQIRENAERGRARRIDGRRQGRLQLGRFVKCGDPANALENRRR